MSTRQFPVPAPEDGQDARFTYGLVVDVAAVLAQHGYPSALEAMAVPDFLALQAALFDFLHTDQASTVPQSRCA